MNNPYVGPRTFQPRERAKFFGRTREARELTSLIIANRLVLFYSPSGAGKSSLLNTMVGPMLAEAGFEVLPTGRVSCYTAKEAAADNIYIFNLLLSIQGSDEIPAEFAALSLAQFLDNLVQHSGGAYYYDPAYIYPPNAVFKPRVLIIDQFEELVTTNAALWPQRAAFFEQLAEALASDEQLWILLTLREDYVANLDPYLHLTPNRLRHRYYMERLARPAAMEAMQRPVAETRPFTPEAVELLADNLLRIRSADGQTNSQLAQFVEPVQLQAVCYQMWSELSQQPGETITADDVTRFANVDKALTNFYEDTIKKIVAQTNISEVALREWFENELITEAGTRNMVYRGEETTGNLSTAAAEAALGCFILREEVRPGGIWYEMVHDRLVQPILNANQSWRFKQPLPRLAQRWQEGGRSNDYLLDERELHRQTKNNEWRLLGPLVIEFVSASQKAQNMELEKNRKREMQHQVQMAEAEKRRAEAERQRAEEAEKAAVRQKRLRTFALALAGIAFVLAIWAVLASTKAKDSQAIAQAESTRAYAESTRAYAESTRASRESAKAQAESTRAAENEVAARSSAALAEARRLAYSAEQLLAEGNVIGSLLIGREIYNRVQVTDNVGQVPTAQDAYGALWLTLQAAANHNISGTHAFRRPVISPTGLIITRTITIGPEPDTLSTWHQGKLVWWEIHGNEPLTYTYQLPLTITHAVFNHDRTILAVAAESTVHLLHRTNDSFEPIENQRWSIRENNVEITAMAFSRDGNQLAVAFCTQVETTPTLDRSPTITTTADSNQDDPEQSRSPKHPSPLTKTRECFIHVKPGDDLAKEVDHLVVAGENPVLGLAFVDNEGSTLTWNSHQTIQLESLRGEQEWQAPPAERNQYYTTITVIDNSGWLIIAGCELQDGQAQPDNPCRSNPGFMRWWHLDQGDWLPAANTSAPIENLLYVPERQTLISKSATGQVNEWFIEFTHWPEVACQIAGRNLNTVEWANAFPAMRNTWQEDYSQSRNLTVACREFGLDLSFASSTLLKCDEKSIDITHYLYNRSERATINGSLVARFEPWALSKLTEAALVYPERAPACLSLASQIDTILRTEDKNELLTIIEQLDQHQSQQALNKIEDRAFIENIDVVAEQIQQMSLPSEIAAVFELNLLALYDEACAMRLTIREENAACATYDRLQQQLSTNNALTVVPVSGQPGRFLFLGQSDTFVNVEYITPFLTVSNVEGRLLAESNSQVATNYASQMAIHLPEKGIYYLEAALHPSYLEHLPPVISVYEPPTLPFDEVLDVTQLQQTWRFTAVPGDIIEINVDSINAADWFDLALQIRNEQWQLLLSDVLREDRFKQQFVAPDHGTYYISMQWELGDPDRHSVSLSLVKPQRLAVNEPVIANATDRHWEFTGSNDIPVQLELHSNAFDGVPRLFLYDEYNSLLAFTNNDIGDSNIRLDALLMENGTYRVEVDWWGTAEPYTITLTLVEPVSITLNDTIETDSNQRWWQFEGPAEENIVIELDTLETISYLSMGVYDTAGFHIASAEGWDTERVLVEVFLPEDGLYTIQTDWYSEPTLYRLVLNASELNEPVAPGEVGETETIQYGQSLPGRPEQQRWQFEANRGDFITIAMDSTDHDPYLRLFDANGVQVAFDDDGGVGLNALIQFLIVEDGLYEIDANWYNPANPGPYTLSLNHVEALLLQLDETVATNEQQRIWQFSGQLGQIITIQSETTDETMPFFTVVDAQGNHLPVNEQFDNEDQQVAFWYTWLPTEGRYYLVINWYDTPGMAEVRLSELNTVLYPDIVTAVNLEQISYLFRQGLVDEGLTLFQRNRHIFNSSSGHRFNEICWFGSLWGYVTDVMFACQTAVFLDPNNPDYPDFVDSRGVARAMIGDFAGAIADFRYYAEYGWYDVERRYEWIAELTAGRNPFDDQTLLDILRQP